MRLTIEENNKLFDEFLNFGTCPKCGKTLIYKDAVSLQSYEDFFYDIRCDDCGIMTLIFDGDNETIEYSEGSWMGKDWLLI